MIQLEASWAGLLVTLIIAWTGLLFGGVKWLVDRNQEHFDRKFSEMDQRLGKVSAFEREFLEFKANLPLMYVLRDDFLRSVSGIQVRLDFLSSAIQEVVKRD